MFLGKSQMVNCLGSFFSLRMLLQSAANPGIFIQCRSGCSLMFPLFHRASLGLAFPPAWCYGLLRRVRRVSSSLAQSLLQVMPAIPGDGEKKPETSSWGTVGGEGLGETGGMVNQWCHWFEGGFFSGA